MSRRSLSLFAAIASLLTASTASAASDSIITAGLGTTLGANSTTQLNGQTTTSFSNELSLKVKGLYVLGFEFAYSPTDRTGSSASELIFTNDLRLSGLLYFLPTPYVQAYAKAGIEADNFGGLFSINDPSNAYHVGGGIDVNITENIVIGIEWLVLIPGKRSVETQVNDYIDEETRRAEQLARAGQIPTDIGADAPGVGDFLSASNFRLNIGARYYF